MKDRINKDVEENRRILGNMLSDDAGYSNSEAQYDGNVQNVAEIRRRIKEINESAESLDKAYSVAASPHFEKADAVCTHL